MQEMLATGDRVVRITSGLRYFENRLPVMDQQYRYEGCLAK